jgi:hypothetical protein
MSPAVRSALVAAALFFVAMSVVVHHAGAPTVESDAALVAGAHHVHHGEDADGATDSTGLGIAMSCLGLLVVLAIVLSDPRRSLISRSRGSTGAQTFHRSGRPDLTRARTPVSLRVVLLV